MLLILLSVALLALGSVQGSDSESSSEEFRRTVLEPAQTQAQMRIFSYDVLENTENTEDHHLLLMMKTKMRKLHQGHPHQGHPHPVMNLSQIHPHQRSNLSRVQMRTDYPSNLKVINRA
nr:PREDICTED: uncharacterized protein LOC106700781 isoform X1 [Bos mutus]